ncbi:very-long-chain (3R)-3-hydroxyacyl-CoA dehydratase 2-like isoform X2 [Tubulanus polymorphus]|uniref:very-long-chain (3R)-3-hydroxyacyl-CoA dehydratase 2-like isoform X2 n=1 Tax=Tubulanus polymorphus TaxID=672921 RepID=UPI003DA4CC53
MELVRWCKLFGRVVRHYLDDGRHDQLYAKIELDLKIFQTGAVLEIIHCAIGIVPSSVVLTAFQVFSRVFLTWGVVHSVKQSQESVGVALFVFAWTVTEMIRYSFYVFGLIGRVPYLLQWCRYTFFIVLYPIGVTGELLTIYSSLSHVKRTALYSIDLPNQANVSFSYYYYLLFIMISYLPVFPQLYGHMLKQRKKVIGGGGAVKAKSA